MKKSILIAILNVLFSHLLSAQHENDQFYYYFDQSIFL